MDALSLARMLRQVPYPTNENPDYDLSGYVSKYGIPDQSKGQHLTDEFKLPEHPTFSTFSRYSQPDMQGGTWQSGGNDRWLFSPSQFNNQMKSPSQFTDYFKQNERKNSFIKLPDGTFVEGSK